MALGIKSLESKYSPHIVAIMGSRSFFGAERANIDLLRMMKESGAQVLCVVRDEQWPENLKLQTFLDESGLDWRNCPFASLPQLRYWRYWPNVILENIISLTKGNRRFRKICQEFGATHIHTFNPFMSVSFLLALNKLNLPLIYRCGDYPTYHNKFWRWVWRWLSNRVTHFCTESHFVKDMLVELGVSPDKVSVIPAPAPRRNVCSRFAYDIESGRDGKVFVYIGQLSSHKGVDILIEAFELLLNEVPNQTLLVAGPVDDDWARALRDKTLARIHGKSIIFLDHVEDVHGMLLKCDVHVAPTVKPEPYGLVTVEAKAASRPSIVFAGGGLSELVVDGVDGIVIHEKSAKALAGAMLTYCLDQDRAKFDGIRAFESLNKRIGTDRYIERWRAIYDHTLPAL